MIISAVGCAFSGLCYAEFAAMVPWPGAPTRTRIATPVELVAWIIGWDLILEYALSVSTVAVGWSGYFVTLAHDARARSSPAARWPAPCPRVGATCPRPLIVLLVSALLVDGIKRVRQHQHRARRHQGGRAVLFVVAGAAYVSRAT